jgi:hypothetical protein
MMRMLLPLLTMLVGSCAVDPLPKGSVAVETMQENAVSWDGQIVIVDGWLGKCQGYECQIFVSQAAAMANPETRSRESSLPIGASDKFDREAESFQFSRVLLKARINKLCVVEDCKDRADVLQPISITKWAAQSASSKKVDQ